jgi:hypothetical protein
MAFFIAAANRKKKGVIQEKLENPTARNEHQETGKSYVAPTRGYGGYTHHVTSSVVPIAPVSLRSLDGSLGSPL